MIVFTNFANINWRPMHTIAMHMGTDAHLYKPIHEDALKSIDYHKQFEKVNK